MGNGDQSELNTALELSGPAGWIETWAPAGLWLAGANSKNTRRSYAEVLRQFAGVSPVPLPSVSAEHAIAFKFALVDSGRAPATIRHRILTMRGFFRWAIAAGHYTGPNPFAGVPIPRSRRFLKARALSCSEVDRLLAAVSSARDRALLALLADAGLRASEVVSLFREDVRTDGGRWIALVRAGKGGKDRRVPITNRARDLVREYLGPGSGRIAGAGLALFQARGGSGLSRRQVARIVAQAAQAAGLGSLSPHDLRRTFATRALEAGAPIGTVRAAMGHSSISTTAGYYRPGGSGPSVAEFLEGAGSDE